MKKLCLSLWKVFSTKNSLFKKKIFNSINPTSWHNDFFSIQGKKCIMICHDQIIDRRILQQAVSLKKIGVNTLIVCLAQDDNDLLEKYQGIYIHRIGLKKIIPDCFVYFQYQKFKEYVLCFRTFSTRMYRLLEKLNTLLYKVINKIFYCSKNINHPLPFNECFYRTAYLYQADFLVAHDVTALVAAHRIALKRKVPLIYDAHEFYYEQRVFSLFQKMIIKKAEKKCILGCSKVFTVSESIASLMQKRYNIDKPTVLLNTVPQYEVLTHSSTLSDLLGSGYQGHKIILFQGGVFPNRNIENLVKGFLMLLPTDIKLFFLGPSDAAFLKHLKKIIGLENNRSIFFLPSVSSEILMKYTSSADLGIIPYLPYDLNTRYCLSNKLFEFIQAEVPFVYHKGLLEIDNLAKDLGVSDLAIDFQTSKTTAVGLAKVLDFNLEKYKKLLKDRKHIMCWENEEKKFLMITSHVLNLNEITNLAQISDSTDTIEGFEFQKILSNEFEESYSAADTLTVLPHYIVLDFSQIIRLTKLEITWESFANYALFYSVEYFDLLSNQFITLLDYRNLNGKYNTLFFKNEKSYNRIRIMVHKTFGQERLLIRKLRLFGEILL